jgi:hypothetical protein
MERILYFALLELDYSSKRALLAKFSSKQRELLVDFATNRVHALKTEKQEVNRRGGEIDKEAAEVAELCKALSSLE